MLIKEQGGKVNFIDKNDNFVGFDFESCCCEQFGYFFSINKEESEEITDTAILDSCYFTLDSPEEDENSVMDKQFVHFKCVSSIGTVYLTLFNQHNGYYSHLWEASTGCDGYL